MRMRLRRLAEMRSTMSTGVCSTGRLLTSLTGEFTYKHVSESHMHFLEFCFATVRCGTGCPMCARVFLFSFAVRARGGAPVRACRHMCVCMRSGVDRELAGEPCIVSPRTVLSSSHGRLSVHSIRPQPHPQSSAVPAYIPSSSRRHTCGGYRSV